MQTRTVDGDTPKRAVVIEDDDVTAHVVEVVLQREGFAVTRAPDGRTAQEILKTDDPPALVTLDVMLPHFDGFHLIAAIRESPTWRDVPVLMLSSRSQEQDVVRALDGGANDYILKPFKPEELRARIRRLLKNQEDHRRS